MKRLHGMAALAATYATRLHWHVFACVYGGKEPLAGSHGFCDATTDLARIAEMFSARDRLNLAVSCAPSGIVVVDIDVRNDGDQTLRRLEREHGSLPHTPRVYSGSDDGSQHYYFSAVEGARYPAKLGPGIDVKHARGYVLLPPSTRRPDEDCRVWRRYRWDLGASLTDTPLAASPEWIAVGGKGAPTPKPRPEAVGTAPDSFLGVAFERAGWLGPALTGGRVAVRCPWADQHTDKRGRGADSSCVLLPPTVADVDRVGRFTCAHAHCSSRRARDVLAVLPKHAIAVAAAKYPRALGRLAWRSARARLEEVQR